MANKELFLLVMVDAEIFYETEKKYGLTRQQKCYFR